MSLVICDMSVSLDGYVVGSNDSRKKAVGHLGFRIVRQPRSPLRESGVVPPPPEGTPHAPSGAGQHRGRVLR